MIGQGYRHIGTVGIDDFFVKPDKVKLFLVSSSVNICIIQINQLSFYRLIIIELVIIIISINYHYIDQYMHIVSIDRSKNRKFSYKVKFSKKI